MPKVLIVLGTRPEAIKMAPVIKELEKHPDQIESVLCVTAQHREMLDQILDFFAIRPDVDLHFAPTQMAADALREEGVPAENIFITGNTVIDALLWSASRCPSAETVRFLGSLGIPVPPGNMQNLHTEKPGASDAAPCDGQRIIQEEAPSLGKPVLVMRSETERPEAVKAGTAKVVGTQPAAIIEETERLLYDQAEYEQMAKAINPYGDGIAAEAIVKVILAKHGCP